MYQRKRDILVTALQQTPLQALIPQGSYFVMTDTSALKPESDVALADSLPESIGVVAIPPSAFYSDGHKHLAKNLLRFSFSRTDDAMLEAGRRLKQLSP
jgi:aspartate/methionine/tyrosine aminotransferase